MKHIIALLLFAATALAESPAYAPDRKPGEGEGPFQRLIIRGATLIDGTGAPAVGPVDIVIEGNRIREVRSVGYPKMAIKAEGRPKDATREIDGTNLYVLPGFIDMHGHIGGSAQGTTAEYVYKLWMAHGVTTVREPGCGNGVDWCLHERDRSARNEIVAPRLFPYIFPNANMWDGGPIDTPDQARKFAQWVAKKGADGIKILGPGTLFAPEVLGALLDEANKLHLGTTTHMAQLGVGQMTIIQAARLGLRGMEHWYGLPESMLAGSTIQNYPLDYNYNDESHRFGEAGRLWKQAAAPESEKWNATIDELIKLHFNIDPTLNIYEASRDLMRAMRAEWHDRYTLPSLWRFYTPSRAAHGSYWYKLDDGGRSRVEEQLPALDAVSQRLQEPRRSRDHRLRLGIHLSALRLRLHSRARAVAGSGISSAGSHSLRDAVGRAGADGAEGNAARLWRRSRGLSR